MEAGDWRKAHGFEARIGELSSRAKFRIVGQAFERLERSRPNPVGGVNVVAGDVLRMSRRSRRAGSERTASGMLLFSPCRASAAKLILDLSSRDALSAF